MAKNLSVRGDQCFECASAIIRAKTPYVFGGGHPGFGPSGSPKPGYDCSGFASAVLKAGGILRVPPAQVALNTEEFLDWGVRGPGELTVWVRNDKVEQHCFLEFFGFARSGKALYCEAPHTGLYCHWFTDPVFTGFQPRHWPGL